MANLRYTGTIRFEDCTFAMIVKRFDYVGKGNFLINWHSPPAERAYYQFLGVAQEIENHKNITPWVYLTDKNGVCIGNDHMAQIKFTTIMMNDSEVSIEGKWLDVDETEFPFTALLTRNESSSND